MVKALNLFNKVVIYAILITITLLVVTGTLQLFYYIFHHAVDARLEEELGFLSAEEYVLIFSLIMNIIIILELYETIKMYLEESKFHAESILLVTLIAVSRSIIMIEFKGEHFEPILIFSTGALLLSLSGSYYLIKRSRRMKDVKELGSSQNK
ncbi:phosphate-starvation-inducible PsiE family protein [Bacteroidota bacterium]